jgi:hypothetical protein
MREVLDDVTQILQKFLGPESASAAAIPLKTSEHDHGRSGYS